jgi:hypothetical protein
MSRFVMLATALFGSLVLSSQAFAEQDLLELAKIRPKAGQGFANSGWKFDRYPNLPTLDAKKSMLVADLEGPGVIRAIHFTRHMPKELAARGVVLEIYFDDAAEPAVRCPIADFFGDGCNGNATNFSTNFIECAPVSYNCYIPMPFRQKAKILLRNDTDQNFMNYSFVEWEKLPEWKKDLGYFHATYRRKCFQLGPRTAETFFEVAGGGHLLGRQFSVVTDEPMFKEFAFVMEGNNEVDIDGQKRAIDYLGSEDSFTFSWGFQAPFAGHRAGITLMQPTGPSKLSLYRFHDYQPIRFDKSLRWTIDWSSEGMVPELIANLNKTGAEGGCWVDYATVHYWYQDQPGGFKHAELESVADRMKPMLKPEKK